MAKTCHVHLTPIPHGWRVECERCKRQTDFSTEEIAREVARDHRCEGRG